MVLCLSGVDGYVVRDDGTVVAAYGLNAHHLEGFIAQVVNRARQNVVSFTFEFRACVRRALIGRKHRGIKAIRVRLGGVILGAKLHFGAGKRGDLRPIVEPS